MPTSKRQAVTAGAAGDVPDNPVTWLSVQEVASRTGISAAGVRNYVTAGHARSTQRPGPRGMRTEVALEDVVARRSFTLGEPVTVATTEAAEVAPGAALVPFSDVQTMVADYAQRLNDAERRTREQVERAAKAETIVEHLREQLAEMREQEGTRSVSHAMPPQAAEPRRGLFGRRKG